MKSGWYSQPRRDRGQRSFCVRASLPMKGKDTFAGWAVDIDKDCMLPRSRHEVGEEFR